MSAASLNAPDRHIDGTWRSADEVPRMTDGRPEAFVAINGHGSYPYPGRVIRLFGAFNDHTSRRGAGAAAQYTLCNVLLHMSTRWHEELLASHHMLSYTRALGDGCRWSTADLDVSLMHFRASVGAAIMCAGHARREAAQRGVPGRRPERHRLPQHGGS